MAAKAEEPPPSPLPATDSLRDPPPPQSIGDISSSPLEKRADAEVEEEEKRGDEDEGPREAKRRRTFPAALDKISAVAAAPATSEDDDDGSRSFSFQARSIAPIEMTPKFGSFNSSAILGDASPLSSPEVALEEEDTEKMEANGRRDEGKDGN